MYQFGVCCTHKTIAYNDIYIFKSGTLSNNKIGKVDYDEPYIGKHSFFYRNDNDCLGRIDIICYRHYKICLRTMYNIKIGTQVTEYISSVVMSKSSKLPARMIKFGEYIRSVSTPCTQHKLIVTLAILYNVIAFALVD